MAAPATTLSISNFINYDEGGPGGNLSAYSVDLEPHRRRLNMNGQVRVGIWTVALVGVCDIEFPEPARVLRLQGAELLVLPTALGEG